MAPLIGVTTSEVRRGELATLRRHGEPPQHEMALGLTYMRANTSRQVRTFRLYRWRSSREKTVAVTSCPTA